MGRACGCPNRSARPAVDDPKICEGPTFTYSNIYLSFSITTDGVIRVWNLNEHVFQKRLDAKAAEAEIERVG